MKILAIEKELQNIESSDFNFFAKDEARMVYLLQQSDIIREIYFTEENNAVIILECEDTEEARSILSELPFVKNGLIEFTISELKPYLGFSRLMNT